MNLYEKILKASAVIGELEKDLQVGKGSGAYKAISDNAVLKAVLEAERKFNLVSIPTKMELIRTDMIEELTENCQKITLFVDVVKLSVKIVDIDDPEQFVWVEAFARGIDYADKGFGKAATYARKYALMNAYKITTHSDPDEEKSTKHEILPDNKKRERIYNVVSKNYNELQNILKAFNVESLEELTKEQVEAIYETLQNKRKL